MNERRKICKSVTMAMWSTSEFFFTVFSISFVCIFIQSNFNILKLMFVYGNLYYDMSIKFDKFLKNNVENFEILSSAETFSNDVNWRCCELPRNSFEYRFTHFKIMSINKVFFFNLRFCSYITLRCTLLCITD